MKKILAALLLCALALSALSPSARASDKIKDVFELYPNDSFFQLKLPSGEKIFIDITESSDPTATAALLGLNHSLFTARRKDGTGGAIFLVGTLGGKAPEIPAQPGVEATPARTVFKLRSLIIGIPYLEYPDKSAQPKLRDTVLPTDFAPALDPRTLHLDTAHHLYWIGDNPFRKLSDEEIIHQ